MNSFQSGALVRIPAPMWRPYVLQQRAASYYNSILSSDRYLNGAFAVLTTRGNGVGAKPFWSPAIPVSLRSFWHW
jgi:hypothetical protein